MNTENLKGVVVSVARSSLDVAKQSYEIGRKEFLGHWKTKRLLGLGLTFAALFLLISIIASYVTSRAIAKAGGYFSSSEFPNAGAMILMIVYTVTYFVIPLLAITLSFDSIVGEWQNKTIFLLLSKPVRRVSVVLGKLGGAFASIGVIFLPVAIIGYIAILVNLNTAGVDVYWSDIGRTFASFGIILLGLAAFASLGLLVSTMTKTTTSSIIRSAISWLVLFPMIGYSGSLIAVLYEKLPTESALAKTTLYLNPGYCMKAATSVIAPELYRFEEFSAFLPFVGVPASVGTSVLMLLLFTVLCTAGAGVIFWGRNLE
ncbi:MAG: hypothetical protein CVT48_05770 [Thermoplasmata archaeon HGW-Thermoplasmata-1]|nr:MAG: hypothetical protein CVT48_05770 [Thermoplasmata archaeon HGW-Thermoplasmata-1]